MHPAMALYAVIFLAIFLLAYGLSGLGIPLGIIVPILALIDGILILLGK